MFYIVTFKNEVKPYYGTNKENQIVVYDRDSTNGLTIQHHYKRIFSNYDIDRAFPDFLKKAKAELKEGVYRYLIAIWNDIPSEDYYPEYDIELEKYIEQCCARDDIAALYFREVCIFQRNIIAFDENFLSTYRGQFANADKKYNNNINI